MRFLPGRFRRSLKVATLALSVILFSVIWVSAGLPAGRQALAKLDPRLVQLSAVTQGLNRDALTASSLGTNLPGTQPGELARGQVRITLIAEDMAAVPALRQQIRALGGKVEAGYRTWVQALVPIAALDQLAQLPHLRQVRLPLLAHPTVITGQEVRLSGAPAWQKAGFTGKGVKVGILDFGFRGYKKLLGKELPATVVLRSFRRDGKIEPDDGSEADVHGLAVAEIVHEMAPDAQLFFTDFDTAVSFFNALNWLLSQKVDIINFSGGFFSGCYNGNGSLDDPRAFSDNQGQFERVRKAGVLFVNSGGNEAQEHWGGRWQDPDNNGELNFTANDNQDSFQARKGDPIYVELSWDDSCFTGSNNDYDLFLEDNTGKVIASSTERQQGRPNDLPVEEISLRSAPFSGTYYIVVKRIKASRVVHFNLFALQFRLSHSVAAGSMSEPSISSNVMTVGAIFWRNLKLEPFSSQGPTLDGRIKPDIAGVDGVSNVTFGQFFGTSASSPQVAGAAALVKQAFPAFGPDEIQNYLEKNAEDFGPPGKDNQYGSGMLTLGALPAGSKQAPNAPSDLSAKALSSSSIQLNWTDNSDDESGFQLERRLPPGDFSLIKSTAANVTGFTDKSLKPATTYCYRVRAVNDGGQSEFSNIVCAATQAVLPLISSIEPTQGVQSSSLRAVIKGQRLGGARAVSFSGLGLSAQIQAGGSETALPILITISPDAAPGPRSFNVTTEAGTSDSGMVVFTVLPRPGQGVLIALRFDKLEFLVPADWLRKLQDGCVIYTNIGQEASTIRLTPPAGRVQEFEIPAGQQVIVCGDVAHIDTRSPPQ